VFLGNLRVSCLELYSLPWREGQALRSIYGLTFEVELAGYPNRMCWLYEEITDRKRIHEYEWILGRLMTER